MGCRVGGGADWLAEAMWSVRIGPTGEGCSRGVVSWLGLPRVLSELPRQPGEDLGHGMDVCSWLILVSLGQTEALLWSLG